MSLHYGFVITKLRHYLVVSSCRLSHNGQGTCHATGLYDVLLATSVYMPCFIALHTIGTFDNAPNSVLSSFYFVLNTL